MGTTGTTISPRRMRIASAVFVAMPWVAGAAVALWPGSLSLAARLACELDASPPDFQHELRCAPRLQAQHERRMRSLRPSAEGAVCVDDDEGCHCSIVDDGLEYSMRSHTDWFGGGPDAPGWTGISVTTEGASWRRELASGLLWSSVDPPARAARYDDVLCVTFGEDLYALDAHDLTERTDDGTPLDRFRARLSWPFTAPLALMILWSSVGGLGIRRALTLERAFGSRAERATPATCTQDRTVYDPEATALRARRTSWHGPSPATDGSEVWIASGDGERRTSAYRSDERTLDVLHVFVGTRESLRDSIVSRRRLVFWSTVAGLGLHAALLTLIVALLAWL